jgi:hypothetical protein
MATDVQNVVRDIDSGRIAVILRVSLITFLIVGLSVLYFLNQFRGLGTEQAMDHAQIARSLVSGEGFSTRYVRPLQVTVMKEHRKVLSGHVQPEIYNAPLFPLLEAAALFPFRAKLNMSPSDILAKGDRVIAILGFVLLLAGVTIWFFVGKMLFDRTIALICSCILLVTDLLWQYAISGLPQLLLIILFGAASYCLLKARSEDEAERQPLPWIAAGAFFLALMSLTHGLTAFMMPAVLVFCYLGFRARFLSVIVTVLVYSLSVLPWLIHNYKACGLPLGLSIYDALSGAGISESALMRGKDSDFLMGSGLPTKIRDGLLSQASVLWACLGLSVSGVACVVSLMHPFRSHKTSLWRWVVLGMWLGITLGTALWGFGDLRPVSGNQLHVIFLPVFVLYGTAFLLVLWNRLGISQKELKIISLCVLLALSAAPMLSTFLVSSRKGLIQWPPYIPPVIGLLNTWYGPKDLLCSDMPWAVAWYANRQCLLLPDTIRRFNEISDYSTLGSPIVGLYLTPLSGNQPFNSLVKGEYKEWGPVIMRTINPGEFLLKKFTPLPVDGECILFADTERWASKAGK